MSYEPPELGYGTLAPGDGGSGTAENYREFVNMIMTRLSCRQMVLPTKNRPKELPSRTLR